MAENKYVFFGGFTLLIEDIKLIQKEYNKVSNRYEITITTKEEKGYFDTYEDDYDAKTVLNRLHKIIGCEQEDDQFYRLKTSVYELRNEIKEMRKSVKSLVQVVKRSMKKE